MNKFNRKLSVFVAMPFGSASDERYELAIKPACDTAGASCQRADELVFHGQILQEICSQIAKADTVIADVSEANSNVWFEVGYAHALGKYILLIVVNPNDVPFDIGPFRVILHDGSFNRLKDELIKSLKSFFTLQQQGMPNKITSLNPSDEQRIVAVVFGDIVGFTSIRGNLGELDFAAFIGQYFTRVLSLLIEYGGHLTKLVGDGFLAFFNSASDAVSFAQELFEMGRDPKGLKETLFPTRIGIHVGQVLITHKPYGEDLIGDAVALAVRLSNAAGPGEIILSETAHSSLPKGYIKVPIAEREVHLKGFAQEFHVYVIGKNKGGGGNESE